ncbi:MAG: rhodanese-like domain-containing protein [Alphaproteobacteria bacterium]|nr:rhodanese-like domain-containing protein [Alphaproteobacteria bacterium]
MAVKKTVKQLVMDAENDIRTLAVLEAAELLESDDHVFVDLRDVRELEHEGMVPEAFHAPRGMIEFWVCPDSPYHKEIFSSGKTFVFYCRSGWRSALATKAVQDMGLENVCHIQGGFSAWKEVGAPVIKREARKKKNTGEDS